MEPHGEDPDDASLDFLSPDFDPQRVLAVSPSKVQLPCPSVQPCDNLDTYDSIMLGTRKTFSAGDVIVKDVEDSGRKEVGVASSQQTTVTIMRQQIKTVLTFMESKLRFLIFKLARLTPLPPPPPTHIPHEKLPIQDPCLSFNVVIVTRRGCECG